LWRSYLGSGEDRYSAYNPLSYVASIIGNDTNSIMDRHSIKEYHSIADKYAAESSLPSQYLYSLPQYKEFARPYDRQEYPRPPPELLPLRKMTAKQIEKQAYATKNDLQIRRGRRTPIKYKGRKLKKQPILYRRGIGFGGALEGNPMYVPNLLSYPTIYRDYFEESFFPWVRESTRPLNRALYHLKYPINAVAALSLFGSVIQKHNVQKAEAKARKTYKANLETEALRREMGKEAYDKMEIRRRTSDMEPPLYTEPPSKPIIVEDVTNMSEHEIGPYFDNVVVPDVGIKLSRSTAYKSKPRNKLGKDMVDSINKIGTIDTIKKFASDPAVATTIDGKQLISMLTSNEAMQRALNEGQQIPEAFYRFLPDVVVTAIKTPNPRGSRYGRAESRWLDPETAKISKRYWENLTNITLPPDFDVGGRNKPESRYVEFGDWKPDGEPKKDPKPLSRGQLHKRPQSSKKKEPKGKEKDIPSQIDLGFLPPPSLRRPQINYEPDVEPVYYVLPRAPGPHTKKADAKYEARQIKQRRKELENSRRFYNKYDKPIKPKIVRKSTSSSSSQSPPFFSFSSSSSSSL
jgi:hypothetical protein